MGQGLLFEAVFIGGLIFIRRGLVSVTNRHRRTIEASGYREIDPGKRIRLDRYWRCWFLTYTVLNLLGFLLDMVLTRGRAGYSAAILGILGAAFPSFVLAFVGVFIAEFLHPQGHQTEKLIEQEYILAPVQQATEALGSSRIKTAAEMGAVGEGPLENLPPVPAASSPARNGVQLQADPEIVKETEHA